MERRTALALLLFAGTATGEEAPATGTAAVAKPAESPAPSRVYTDEPTYSLIEPAWGPRELNAKLQVSLAFRLLGDPDAEAEPGDDRPSGLYLAYSQTSFWDLSAISHPFLDSSYRPEAWWHQGFAPGLAGADGLAIEAGVGHESNGRAGPESRSMDKILLRPIVAWDLGARWWLRLAPRAVWYAGIDDNPDIARYRGHVEADCSLGRRESVQLSLHGRLGTHDDRGSVEADLSYPLDALTGRWLAGYVYVQWFWGWSESLLAYDQRVEQPRVLIGFALVR